MKAQLDVVVSVSPATQEFIQGLAILFVSRNTPKENSNHAEEKEAQKSPEARQEKGKGKAIEEDEALEESEDLEELEEEIKPSKKSKKGKGKAVEEVEELDDELEEGEDLEEDEEDLEEDEPEEIEEEIKPTKGKKGKKEAASKPPKHTADDINAACKLRAKQSGRPHVLNILKKKFGVTSISDLQPHQYGDVIEAMK